MQIWEAFLAELDEELGKATVDKWLRSLEVLRFDACNLYLRAKDSFQLMWFEEHVRKRCALRLLNNNKKRIQVHISVSSDTATLPSPERKKAAQQGSDQEAAKQFSLRFDEWDPHCRFETFVPSEASLLPLRLLRELVGLEGSPEEASSFNPIYLWGANGTGKTHLLTATAQAMQEQGKRVRFAHSDSFTEHVVSAIRAGEMHRFRQAYRDVDILIIDDIQVFSKKRATQEEFFHTFNALHVENKQILIAADRPPLELDFVEPRLISRFEWGIVLPLEKPAAETVRAILLAKAEELGVKLHAKVIDYILSSFDHKVVGTIRALEALILRTHLNAHSPRSLQTLTLPEAEILLRDLVQESKLHYNTPDKIIAKVSEFYGVRVDDILSKSQSREFVVPRKIAMYFCRSLLRLPFTKIGGLFGRDHSTVMSSCKTVQKQVKEDDPEVAPSVYAIRKVLQAR